MASDHFNSERNSARVGNALIPSAQDAKAQATRIYEALDAKGYGIIKRQQVADALPDNKVSGVKASVMLCHACKHSTITCACSTYLLELMLSRSSKRYTWTQKAQSVRLYSSRYCRRIIVLSLTLSGPLCKLHLLLLLKLCLHSAGVCPVLSVSRKSLSQPTDLGQSACFCKVAWAI